MAIGDRLARVPALDSTRPYLRSFWSEAQIMAPRRWLTSAERATGEM
jgi:hypothetical protein